VGQGRVVHIATTSRDPGDAASQIQQQSTGATPDTKLSRTELNILKTMIYVVVCFVLCWTPSSIAIALKSLTVSLIISSFVISFR